MKSLWHWLNATFGIWRYFKLNDVLYIKEGFNQPEPFYKHLENHYPEQLKQVNLHKKRTIKSPPKPRPTSLRKIKEAVKKVPPSRSKGN